MTVRMIRTIDFGARNVSLSIPKQAERVAPQRLVLAPISWGKRDPDLAKAVCHHILDATPPMVIPFQPLTHRRTRAFLRSHGVHC